MHTSRHLCVRAMLLAASIAFCPTAMHGAGVVSGTIVDDSGKPVGGARVTLMPLAAIPLRPPSVTSAAKGTFAVAGLSPRRYMVCVTVQSGVFVNACTWDTGPVVVNVPNGKDVNGVQVVLKKASFLKVRVTDRQNALPPLKAKGQPRLVIGVFTPRRNFIPATIVRQDNSGRDLQVAIPFDKPLKLHVIAPDLVIQDENKATINPNGHTVAFEHKGDGKGNANPNSNAPQKSFTFEIVKKNVTTNPNPFSTGADR